MHRNPAADSRAEDSPASETDELMEEPWFAASASWLAPRITTRPPPPDPIGDTEADSWFR